MSKKNKYSGSFDHRLKYMDRIFCTVLCSYQPLLPINVYTGLYSLLFQELLKCSSFIGSIKDKLGAECTFE